MKYTKTKTTHNLIIPKLITIGNMISWWEKQSFAYDKGGSFDLELYIRISKMKHYENK